jgi:hypothetical protein
MRSTWVNKLSRGVAYTLSLPERLLRSLAAALGGTSLLLTDILVPESLRGTTLYKVMVGNAQQFLVQKVGQVEQAGTCREEDTLVGDDFVQRKLVGNTLEMAGLLAMHFSPLWVFAIAGDVSAGSKTFLQRLIQHLKINNVIPEDAGMDNLTDLLDVMQAASRQSATAIDMPPLSRAQLQKLVDELRQNYVMVFGKSTALLPHFNELWGRMEQMVRVHGISIEELGGVMAVSAAQLPRKGWGTLRAVGRTSSDLFGESVLESYSITLDGIAKQGVNSYIRENMQPYLRQAVRHFAPAQATVTERWLRSGWKSKKPTS